MITIEDYTTQFSEEIRAFFRDIGVNDDLELNADGSDLRQQNISTRYAGLVWHFTQEQGDQALVWSGDDFPTSYVGAENVQDFFVEPTDEELLRRARLNGHGLAPRRLKTLSPHLRDRLQLVIAALQGSQIVDAARKLRQVRIRYYEALAAVGPQ